jgi:hypothetical protein
MDSATPFWVAQRPSVSPTHLEVTHSHDGRAVDRVAISTDNDVGRAASTAHAVPPELRVVTGAPRETRPGRDGGSVKQVAERHPVRVRDRRFRRRVRHRTCPPDFVAVARAFGIPARERTPAALPSDLASALADDGPHVIVVPAALRMFGPTHM